MTIYEKMEILLRGDPQAREREHKDKYFARILRNNLPGLEHVDEVALIESFRRYATYDRAWRKVTQDNPELRGKDYNNKFHLEANKLKELGYKQS